VIDDVKFWLLCGLGFGISIGMVIAALIAVVVG